MSGRLLVVDDDESIRKLVSRILERSGFEVVPATDGVEAVEFLDSGGPFDGMVLDLMMPRLDGFGVIQHLRDTRREFLSNVLVLSAYADFNHDRIDPACGILQKPFEINELVSAITSCISTGDEDQTPNG